MLPYLVMKYIIFAWLHIIFTLDGNVRCTLASQNQSSINHEAPTERSNANLGTIIAVCVSILLLVSMFVVIVLLFCCKSRISSRETPNDRTSMLSLTDNEIELKNAQVIEHSHARRTTFEEKTKKVVAVDFQGEQSTNVNNDDQTNPQTREF